MLHSRAKRVLFFLPFFFKGKKWDTSLKRSIKKPHKFYIAHKGSQITAQNCHLTPVLLLKDFRWNPACLLTRALCFRIYVGNYVTQSTARNFICPKRKAGRLQLPWPSTSKRVQLTCSEWITSDINERLAHILREATLGQSLVTQSKKWLDF